MNNRDLEYIFSNTSYSEMNIYKNISTLNTMKQYVNMAKEKGFNYEEGIGKGNQKTLTLKRIDGTVIGEIKDMKYPNNDEHSLEIVRDKMKTENLLLMAGVLTTNSKIYTKDELSLAVDEFYTDSNKLAVIKPVNMSQGKGVNVGIKKEDFEYYWQDSISQIKQAGRKNIRVIVQDYLEGFEARAVVIAGKLISIVARVPAYIRGNGKDNIETLVYKKNEMRKKCAQLRKRPIILDEKIEKFIENQGKNLLSIPKKDEYVLLSSISNISKGGEMVDISDFVSNEIKTSAIKSIAAIPGLYSGGVDIMMNSFKDIRPHIIEINAWPMLQSTIFPTYGQPCDPQGYFLNTFYAMDQFLNHPKQIYNIEKPEIYIKNYLEFQDLKIQLQGKQILNNFNG